MNRSKPRLEIKVDDFDLFSLDDTPAKVHMYSFLEKDFIEGDMPV